MYHITYFNLWYFIPKFSFERKNIENENNRRPMV